MATNSGKLNGKGKVNILARAMADVFQECMEKTQESGKEDMDVVVDEMKGMEVRLNTKIGSLDKRVDTTNVNMQAQFAQHRKDVSSDMRSIIKKETPKPSRAKSRPGVRG